MSTPRTDRPRQVTAEELRRRGWRGRLVVLGPAFVAAVAYVDPGNFATNFSAGAGYGYLLIWVIVVANLMAMLIQSLSAKLGIVTGKNLPEMCREHMPRWGSRLMWVQAELVAIATDLAEVIGGAVALHLLFGLPLFVGGLITGVIAFGLLGLQSRGHRPFERAIVFLLAIILVGLVSTLFRTDVDAGALAAGLVPGFAGIDSLMLATGILGATVMPHVIYLHSALTQRRLEPRSMADTRFLLRAGRTDIMLGMGLAGLVNLSMLIVAAALFAGTDVPATDTLEGIFAGLAAQLDVVAAYGFAIALLASGFASSGVGTYAGQVIMAGFLRRRIPLLLRRLLTLAPALVVLGVGIDPTQALVLSQVVLSFGIPFALAPLVWLTARRPVMGELVNHRLTTATATAVTAVVVALNGVLLWQTATGG
ncbi:Nramp family divalent metal transporter [Pseudonocardia parietis]|uniref:Divalent metal cation transporter MntH n=1 Tax=Pseudonocardia parietis TaxID=570936 RepID=A0ABS4W5D8_9PSEU|nr:Nramp family divalent metal transporter [Pseudonocardia parietis]MBP2371437.1 manganese transport protein [Pseudonocardia parietis]